MSGGAWIQWIIALLVLYFVAGIGYGLYSDYRRWRQERSWREAAMTPEDALVARWREELEVWDSSLFLEGTDFAGPEEERDA